MEYLYYTIPLATVIFLFVEGRRNEKKLALEIAQYAEDAGDNLTWSLLEIQKGEYPRAIYSLQKGNREYQVSFYIFYFRRADDLFVPPTLEISKEKVIERLCLVKENDSVKFSRHI